MPRARYPTSNRYLHLATASPRRQGTRRSAFGERRDAVIQASWMGQQVALDDRPPSGRHEIGRALVHVEEVRRAVAVRVEVPGEIGYLLGLEVCVEGGRRTARQASVLADDDRNVRVCVRARGGRIAVDFVDDVVVGN